MSAIQQKVQQNALVAVLLLSVTGVYDSNPPSKSEIRRASSLGTHVSALYLARMGRTSHRVLLIDPEDTPARKRRETSWVSIIRRNGKFYKLDGRSRESRLLRSTRESLIN